MSFFFLYHPSSVAWLPAPNALGELRRKKKNKGKTLEELLEQFYKQKKRQRNKKELELIMILAEIEGDDE